MGERPKGTGLSPGRDDNGNLHALFRDEALAAGWTPPMTAADDTREALASVLSTAFDRKWDDPDLRNADTWLYAADAILASPWLGAHVGAAVAEARGEVEVLREEARRVDTSLFDDTMTLVSQRDTARADRVRLVEAVRGLADEWTGRGYIPHPDKVVAELRALIAGTDDTTTRGTNQEDV